MSLDRRTTLKLIGAAAATSGLKSNSLAAQDDAETTASANQVDQWKLTHDRVWLGGQFWANPMEDWRVKDGAAECQSTGADRNIHLITHQLTNTSAPLAMSVEISRLESNTDAGAGFRLGIRSELNDYRSNTFAGGGINAGLIDGKLVIFGKGFPRKAGSIDAGDCQNVVLDLAGKPEGGKYALTLSATDATGKKLGSVQQSVPVEALLGNIALVNNIASAPKPKKQGARYRFANWNVEGDAFSVDPSRQFGPLLWSMYSLSDSRGDDGFVMKMSALTGPLGEQDNRDVELTVQKEGQWESLGSEMLDPDAWTATFRVPNWNEKSATPYKVVYRQKQTDGSEVVNEWTGEIKANPTGRPLRLGALTCQHHSGFPYEPVAKNIEKLDCDMLYFSGDQLYEAHGGYGIIRDPAGPAILNYLRKFYMFGWCFRDAMRNAPTICLPDDHDVFQGNVWGEGGAKMKNQEGGASSKGGYREPARMVNVVHKTNCGHHPDYFDPTPCEQDISVYYGDMVYGNVSFAILGDRQWKSGPDRVETGSGRADHVKDKNFDTAKLDVDRLVLLGERQEMFLKQWTDDWRGHSMKVVLSQTVFAGVATHHGGYDGYLKADLDSCGWPQTPRDNAIRIMRKGMPLHINGDQHLTSLVQYGVDAQRDSCWSFCTPAISAGYPRWWRPDEVGMAHENRPKHDLPNTGEYIDGLGNKVYVYSVGDPIASKSKHRYERAHEKGSGFGLVEIDTAAKTYTLNSYRFSIDATDAGPEDQFPGWPVTIHQKENGGDNVLG